MGKAQSKRSVDITQEKEGVVVEGESGKVAKIDDIDQLKPQLNGDTNHKEPDSAVSLHFVSHPLMCDFIKQTKQKHFFTCIQDLKTTPFFYGVLVAYGKTLYNPIVA